MLTVFVQSTLFIRIMNRFLEIIKSYRAIGIKFVPDEVESFSTNKSLRIFFQSYEHTRTY